MRYCRLIRLARIAFMIQNPRGTLLQVDACGSGGCDPWTWTTRGVLASSHLTRARVFHPAFPEFMDKANQVLYEEDDRLPQTLSYFILNRLRWRIITGELKPGQALREMEIEADYGSSRGPVRESLRMLLQSGLVETQPRRGFRVREYTPADVRNIYELRATLEGMVVAALEGRDLTPLCDTLRGRLKIMESYYKQKDTDKYFRENSRFHQCIIDFTENKPISQVLFYVNEISLPVRYRLLYEGFLSSRRSLDYHEEITACLEAGDIAGAKAATEAHILENLERATALYESPPGASVR